METFFFSHAVSALAVSAALAFAIGSGFRIAAGQLNRRWFVASAALGVLNLAMSVVLLTQCDAFAIAHLTTGTIALAVPLGGLVAGV